MFSPSIYPLLMFVCFNFLAMQSFPIVYFITLKNILLLIFTLLPFFFFHSTSQIFRFLQFF